jgi:hypothetical protein
MRARAEAEDAVDRLVLREGGGDVGLRAGRVGAVDHELLGLAAVGGERLLEAGAHRLQRQVPLLVVDADGVVGAELRELVAEAGARGGRGEADEGLDAELLVVEVARVEGDHRDAGVERLLDGRAHRARVRNGHGDAVRLLRDGGVHEARLLARIDGALQRLVVRLDVEVGAGVLDALLDRVPERVAWHAVRDDDDLQLLAAGAGGAPGAGSAGGAAGAAPAARDDGGGGDRCGRDRRGTGGTLALQGHG